MLAGLLFATQDAEDRPNLLAATLPFGGATLIEFQARLLIAAGAAQILVAVSRATPELLGAVNRVKRRGVPVDIVRTAAEALEKTHPLATLLVMADGLVTSDAIVATIAHGDGDALLVIDEAHALPGLERIDADTMWAGMARIGPRRLADAARLPDEYDLQSTLLRIAAQGRPQRIVLDPAAVREGHGIERDSRALAQRSRRALGARLATRRPWIDRFVLAPLARRLLPPLVERGGSALAPALMGGVLALAGLALILLRWPAGGLLADFFGIVGFNLAQGLCWLRGEDRPADGRVGGQGGLEGGGVVLEPAGVRVARPAGLAVEVLVELRPVVRRADVRPEDELVRPLRPTRGAGRAAARRCRRRAGRRTTCR